MARPKEPAEPSTLKRVRALFATRTGRVLRGALVASVAFLVASVVVRQARAAVHRMPAYRIGASDVVFVDLPPLVDDRMKAGLLEALGPVWPPEAQAPCTYDAGLDRRLRQLLGAHPMVREVRDVDVRYPRQVRVRAAVRTPLARFRARAQLSSGQGTGIVDVPVDGEGVVLHPDVYAPFLTERQAVLVTGVEALCPGVGRRWLDSREQVAEGLAAARVANLLNSELSSVSAPKVVVVDVSGFPATPKRRAQGEVVLVLSDGRRVQWGRTERNLSDVTREDSYEAKRDRLVDLLEARPTGDPRELDVRFPLSPRAPR